MNELISQGNIIQLQELPPYDIQDYDLFDEKDFRKYINDIKKTVRNSLEYRQYIQYLRLYMNMNECSYFENVNNVETSKVKIEIHHSPYTLEDIVCTVINKRMFYGEEMDVEDVAKEVMYIHYFLMVGLIPLSETVHKLVHNQLLFIPTTEVAGNYKEFEATYGHWIPEEAKEKVRACEERSLTYDPAIDMALLQQNQIPVQIEDKEGIHMIPSLETLGDMMNQRIEEIRYQNSHSLPDNTYDNNKELIPGMIYDE